MMFKGNKKKREYLFTGSWEDRLPAIYYSCMIVALWLYIILEGFVVSAYDIDIPLIVKIIAWGILSSVLIKLCNKIMQHITNQKKDC